MGKVLKVLGIVFLVLVVLFGALLFWAHGEGESQMQRVFELVADGDGQAFVAEMDTRYGGEVDWPLLQLWLQDINENLGAYKELSASSFNTNKELTDEGTVVEATGTVEFEKGEADVQLVVIDDKIAAFTMKSDKLGGDWFTRLPEKNPFYHKRAAKFLTLLCEGKVDAATKMMCPALLKNVQPDQLKAGMKRFAADYGALKRITAIQDKHVNQNDGEHTLFILSVCEFEKKKCLAIVRFDLAPFKAALAGFNIPVSPQEANLTEAQILELIEQAK